MKFSLKPLKDQVIVITGASEKIGLVTARLAAENGAKIVVASKDEQALIRLTDEVNDHGGTAVYVLADVAKEADVLRVGATSVRAFGTFDTWVNITGDCSVVNEASSMEEMKVMFDTNFWGVIYGSRIAAMHLKDREVAGAIINVDSFFTDRPKPQQAVYSATKHAIQSWTDELRIEVEKEKFPVSVSFIHPRKIESYVPDKGKNGNAKYKQDNQAETVAEAILYCAEHAKRELTVGPRAGIAAVLGNVSPKIKNRMKEVAKFVRPEPTHLSAHSNGSSSNGTSGKQPKLGRFPARLYHEATKHPFISTVAFAGLGASIWLWAKRKYKAIEDHR